MSVRDCLYQCRLLLISATDDSVGAKCCQSFQKPHFLCQLVSFLLPLCIKSGKREAKVANLSFAVLYKWMIISCLRRYRGLLHYTNKDIIIRLTQEYTIRKYVRFESFLKKILLKIDFFSIFSWKLLKIMLSLQPKAEKGEYKFFKIRYKMVS